MQQPWVFAPSLKFLRSLERFHELVNNWHNVLFVMLLPAKSEAVQNLESQNNTLGRVHFSYFISQLSNYFLIG